MTPYFVYVTCASAAEAEEIAARAVEGRLAACANIMAPHRAVYRWNGALERGQEVAVILKTTAGLFPALKKEILEYHSYECPCIVALPIEAGHEPFLAWISSETGPLGT